MYNKKTNTLVFPHIILGNVLAGRKYTFNDIHGGIVPISKFNLVVNGFFGGNVELLGLIDRLGFYICPDRFRKADIIRGFYIPEPSMVTEEGKNILQQHYPTAKIIYEKVSVTPHTQLTQAQMQLKLKKIEEAKEYGIEPRMVSNATLEEVEGLIKAAQSGKSGKTVAVESQGVTVQETETPRVVNKTPIRRGTR
jgi:hypothetical protein